MSTVETTEALDALPPEIAVYPGTDADDQHVYIRDTTEGCWVAYVRADCVGVEEIPLPAYVPSQTAADQPTTEPSEGGASCGGRYCTADSEVGPHRHEDGVLTLAPAPQPAADTERAVRDTIAQQLEQAQSSVFYPTCGNPNSLTGKLYMQGVGAGIECATLLAREGTTP